MEQGLRIALDAHLFEEAGAAYVNIHDYCVSLQRFPGGLPEPYALEIAGDRQGAAQAWERLGRPYDAALAWVTSSDEAGLRSAVKTLDDLGARATAAVARRRMKDLGMTAIPRGPHRATRADPAGLTARAPSQTRYRPPAPPARAEDGAERPERAPTLTPGLRAGPRW